VLLAKFVGRFFGGHEAKSGRARNTYAIARVHHFGKSCVRLHLCSGAPSLAPDRHIATFLKSALNEDREDGLSSGFGGPYPPVSVGDIVD
jgi:hypothetical protein